VKSFRSWNRREFAVTQNGYFTILKPTGWFATSRPQGSFRYLGSLSKGFPQAGENQGGEGITIRMQTTEPSAQDRRLMRPALVALAATAISSILLWWLVSPRLP